MVTQGGGKAVADGESEDTDTGTVQDDRAVRYWRMGGAEGGREYSRE